MRHTSAVYRMARSKVVATVEHYVGAGNQFVQHRPFGALRERDYLYLGVVAGDGLLA